MSVSGVVGSLATFIRTYQSELWVDGKRRNGQVGQQFVCGEVCADVFLFLQALLAEMAARFAPIPLGTVAHKFGLD